MAKAWVESYGAWDLQFPVYGGSASGTAVFAHISLSFSPPVWNLELKDLRPTRYDEGPGIFPYSMPS